MPGRRKENEKGRPDSIRYLPSGKANNAGSILHFLNVVDFAKIIGEGELWTLSKLLFKLSHRCSAHAVNIIYFGAWWLSGKFGALRPDVGII